MQSQKQREVNVDKQFRRAESAAESAEYRRQVAQETEESRNERERAEVEAEEAEILASPKLLLEAVTELIAAGGVMGEMVEAQMAAGLHRLAHATTAEDMALAGAFVSGVVRAAAFDYALKLVIDRSRKAY